MACNINLSSLDSCGSEGQGFNYVKNGGTAFGTFTPFSFDKNHVYMPYVELKINKTIYVSGDSSLTNFDQDLPYCNSQGIYTDNINVGTKKSYIQSFEMTVSPTFGGTITIITCDYQKVLELLSVTPPEACEWDEYTLGDNPGSSVVGHIDIGWLIRDCNNNIEKFTLYDISNSFAYSYTDEEGEPQISGPYIYGIFKKAEISYENGVFKVVLTFVDGFSFTEESKLDKIWGREDLKMSFKDAILAAAKFNCNTRQSTSTQKVSRLSIRDNKAWEFLQNDGGKTGPFSVWNSWRQSLFPFLREISTYLLTKNRKGWWFGYDNGSCGSPSFLLLEDRNPNVCINEKGNLYTSGTIPTYIVNGGDCSPVIKFSPSFNAVPLENENNKNNKQTNAPASVKANISIGGGGPNALDQQTNQIFDCVGNINQKNGQIQTTATTQNNNASNGLLATVSSIAEQLNFRSPVNITKETAQAIYGQSIAEAADGGSINIFAPVKATLEIHGDPFWANSLNLFRYPFIRIIFLNPYCLETDDKGNCEWLAKPRCNPKFSGVYKIQSARHAVNAGSYVTSLELYSITIDGNFGIQGTGNSK